MFNRFLLGVVLLVLAAVAGAQYKPAAGETVMRLDVEGRGSIFIRLFTKEAPKTTAHVQGLVGRGFYNGQRFHKVERSPRPFLAQVGAPGSRSGVEDPELASQGSGSAIPYEESGFAHDGKGVVGLSTLPGNRDSGDSQFYILLGPARFLDKNYTIFGKVVSGLDVLDKLTKGDKLTSATIIRG